MPLQVPLEELDTIFRAISGDSSGKSVSELMAALSLNLPRRTLQRRLEHLIAEGRIFPKGEGRGRRYFAATASLYSGQGVGELVRGAEEGNENDRPDWLSPEGVEIRELISQPLSSRTPAGYKGRFLESYLPNETFYLPADLRAELLSLGKVGMTELPAGTYLRQVLDRLLIDLSWNSSRLEGNTYSQLETVRLLELGEIADGKAAEESQMILNHKAAIEMLAEQADEIGFNRYTICNLHALLSDNLMRDPKASGRLRFRAVGIGRSVFYPLEGPQRIEARFLEVLEKADAIRDPFEQSFFVMVHLPYLQPFEDVNKRVSRLSANIPLIQRNLCPLSFVDVEQSDYVAGLMGVYELNRVEMLRDVFVWAYRRSCQRYNAVRETLGQPDPFRLRHRLLVSECVQDAVDDGWHPIEDSEKIEQWAEANLPSEDREEFSTVIRVELESLHEGNIARYRLRPHQFERWKDLVGDF